MKPTDEAKRLRDEIVDYIERQDDPQLCAEWIMDKVLDAVEDRISNYGKSFNEVIHLDGVIEDIDKLRQKP